MLADPFQPVVDLHEAGHALAAVMYRIPFAYVTSATFGEDRGHLQPRMTRELERAILDDDERTMERIAIVSAAGPLAEGREPYGPDRDRFEQFAPDPFETLLEARDFVANYSREIDRIAAGLSLNPRQTLTESEIERLAR